MYIGSNPAFLSENYFKNLLKLFCPHSVISSLHRIIKKKNLTLNYSKLNYEEILGNLSSLINNNVFEKQFSTKKKIYAELIFFIKTNQTSNIVLILFLIIINR